MILHSASLTIVASFILVLAMPRPGSAQGCCTPGTSPLGGLSGSSLRPWSFEFGSSFDGYDMRQAYRGSEKVPDPSRRQSEVARFATYIRLGLPREATVVIQLPYDYRMRDQRLSFGSTETRLELSNHALADLSTALLVRVLSSSRGSGWELDAGAGIKWATGSVERKQDGLTLPVELQTGTGSNDPFVVATANWLFTIAGMTLTALVRFPQEGSNGYRYGTEAHMVAVTVFRLRPGWGVGPELRLRTAQEDRFLGVSRLNTGGWRLMVGPRFSVTRSPNRVAVEGALLWPLRQHLNGLQVGVSKQLLVGLRWQGS